MNRIEARMEKLKEQGKKAFITYMTAGLPDMKKTEELIHVQEQAGVDVIELGIPFSDPVADGPVIQDASYRSIQNGTNLTKIFTSMKRVREDGAQVPVVFMMYYNTVMHYGIDAFVDKCAECGVDGLIIPDLPFEEQGELRQSIEANENAPILIELVSPVSKDRIPMILNQARGFVYCVSQMGVTGNGAHFHDHIKEYLAEVKRVSKIPVMMGFGIRNAEDVLPLKEFIDGAIVGSHFIRLLEDSDYSAQVVDDYIREFKSELNA